MSTVPSVRADFANVGGQVTHVFSNERDLAEALATEVLTRIRQTPSLVLGLPTGRTPVGLYTCLAARPLEAGWSAVRTFNLDEFVGQGSADPGSYRRWMQDALFRHVDMAPDHVGFLDGNAADLAAECERYERAIADAGGIDVMVLGVGVNGHIGFNEPGEALRARTHRARLAPMTRESNAHLFGGDVTRVPEEALSMGMGTILRAREIVLIATGARKAAIVARAFDGAVTTAVPASFLQLHPCVSVWLDDAAATRR
jgi:glucosamine-6-phosphate deaminase